LTEIAVDVADAILGGDVGKVACPCDPTSTLELGEAERIFGEPASATAEVAVSGMIDYESKLRPVLGGPTSLTSTKPRRLGNDFSVDGGNNPLWTQTFLMPALTNFHSRDSLFQVYNAKMDFRRHVN
jgi:hypothetical protein